MTFVSSPPMNPGGAGVFALQNMIRNSNYTSDNSRVKELNINDYVITTLLTILLITIGVGATLIFAGVLK